MAGVSIRCGNCGEGVFGEVVAGDPGYPLVWLLCPNCHDGSVRTNSGAVYPTAPAGSAIKNLPDEVESAWREVRTTYAVATYTACEIMCRKILMHVAVDVVLAPAGESFASYVGALDAAGYFSPGLKSVVDKVRLRGNAANHELPASTEEDAKVTMAITEHLLKSIYELPKL